MDLNTVWFLLIGVLIIGYAILDGFDLGVGIMHIFLKNDDEKRIAMNAIGPVWDGNEVWLITGGGALFAAFPIVYATVFSGFYIAFMLLLTALIFRAVSFEFRNKVESNSWKKFWDWAFELGSLIPALLFGVAFGNILEGVPVDKGDVFTGSFIGLLNPYALLVGLTGLSIFTLHGILYLSLKSEGELKQRMLKSINFTWIAFLILYLISTIYTIFSFPFLFEGKLSNLLFWILLILLLASIIYIPISAKAGKIFHAFLSSSIIIASIIGLSAISLFPRLVPSKINLDYSLTIYNSCSSDRTLFTMLIIAIIGVPIVLVYTFFIYRVFKGKTVISKESY